MHSNTEPVAGPGPGPGDARPDHPSRTPRGVLVVDDHPAVREELERVLGADAKLAPVATAATAPEAVASARVLRPAVAVVDYRLPGRDGVSLTFEMKRLPEPPSVLIYSAFCSARLVLAAIVAGADGVVDKHTGAEQLRAAVSAIAAHRRVMPPLSAAALDALVLRLGPEDSAVVAMLVAGASAEDVAHGLGISGEWLDLRRWAIVQLLVGSHQRSRRSGRGS